MQGLGRRRWLGAVLAVGALYFVVGIVFATLSSASASDQARSTWRLVAWFISAAAFAAHIAYEHFRLSSSRRVTAFHASLSVALGALGLAVAANLHARAAVAGHQRSLTLALLAWPAVTGLLAFLFALLAAAALALRKRSA